MRVGPIETEDPDAWDVIERVRLEHDTGHVTTVETARRPPSGGDSDEAARDLAAELGVTVELACPDCGRTADELDARRRCPACEEPLREVVL